MGRPLVRGPDSWANVETGHLLGDPKAKSKALALKGRIIASQKGKEFLGPGFGLGEQYFEYAYIDTKARLDILCDEFLELLETRRHFIAFETQGGF